MVPRKHRSDSGHDVHRVAVAEHDDVLAVEHLPRNTPLAVEEAGHSLEVQVGREVVEPVVALRKPSISSTPRRRNRVSLPS